MRKKLAALILTVVTVSALSACGADGANNNAGNVPSPGASPTVQQVEQSAEVPEATADAFEAFKSALDDAGYTYEVVPMAADLVGAERGEKYKFDFGSAELYRFADGADALASGEVTLEGFGAFPIEVNGNYGLILSVTENEDAIKAIFSALK